MNDSFFIYFLFIHPFIYFSLDDQHKTNSNYVSIIKTYLVTALLQKGNSKMQLFSFKTFLRIFCGFFDVHLLIKKYDQRQH